MHFLISSFLIYLCSLSALAAQCYPPKPEVIASWGTQLPAAVSEIDLAARLIYAETLATNCSQNKKVVASISQGIAWIIKNRTTRAENSTKDATRFGKGIHGVIFKPQQFSSSLSTKYGLSRWKEFLCPSESEFFALAEKAATSAFVKKESDPFQNTNVTSTYYYRHFNSLPPEKQPKPPAWASPNALNRVAGSFKLTTELTDFNSCIGFFKD